MITVSIIIVLVVWFIHVCTWPGMVFSIVGKSLAKLPYYLRKPLYDCPTCMTVWWGPSIIAIFILAGNSAIANNWQMLLTILIAGGINAMIMLLQSYLGESKKKCNCERRQRLNLE